MQLDNEILKLQVDHEKLENERQYRNQMFNKKLENTEFYDC